MDREWLYSVISLVCAVGCVAGAVHLYMTDPPTLLWYGAGAGSIYFAIALAARSYHGIWLFEPRSGAGEKPPGSPAADR